LNSELKPSNTIMESNTIIAGRSALARGIDQATAGVHETIDSVSGAAHPAVDRAASGAHHGVDKIAGTAAMAANALDATATRLKTTQKKLVGGAGDYVRKHPLTSLGVVIAATLALSRLLSGR
jgi:ElaB/YqjD/DUF883 family membrane-anchored ribosome-binding protein